MTNDVSATTGCARNRSKKAKTSYVTIDVPAQGPWMALSNPIIGLANLESERTEKCVLANLSHQVVFGWNPKI